MSIASPILLLAGILLTIVTIVVGIIRRRPIPRSAGIAIALGMICLSLAAGGVSIRRPDPRRALVLIDMSPSTRTAAFRDPATLESRIRQLLGEVPFTAQTFAEGESVDQTRYVPPIADAVVLFSDGQFDLPATAPPTYIVIDPSLENPSDAAIARLEQHGENVLAVITNPGQPRGVQFIGATGPTTAPAGGPILTGSLIANTTDITVRLEANDAWPENDSLSVRIPSRRESQTWWVSQAGWPANYRAMKPSDLPTDPAAYLQPAVIVLNNLPAASLSTVQQERLAQYVRDLGGGLVILGGDQSHAAGGYLGTPLDALSPLASAPPGPQRYWIILVDSSGSMAAPADGQTRWQRASSAITQVLSALPPNDPVSVGSFARDVQWWSQGLRAVDAAKQPIPQDISPSGPTNIQPILSTLAAQLRQGTVTEIILISDADTTIYDPQSLAMSLRSVRASVNLLLTGANPRTPLLQVVALSGGSMVPQADPMLWAQDAIKLVKSTMRTSLESRPARITYINTPTTLPAQDVPVWNRTWIKSGATELAITRENNATLAMAGRWQLGAGQVAATAFPSGQAEAAFLADLVALVPRDPRFSVTHSTGETLILRVDAIDGNQFLNDLQIAVSLIPDSDAPRQPQKHDLRQAAPGRYELSIPAPRTPSLAVVRVADRIIHRFAVAGRYAPEFNRIGNNREAMRTLATQTGGAVIEPSQTNPIDFRWPARIVSVASVLSILGAAFVSLGLIFWKLR